MQKLLLVLLAITLIFTLSAKANATVLTFDDQYNLGVTLAGSMTWDGTGGGHLFMQNWDDDDYVYFSSPAYVNDFQMNAEPWEGFIDGVVGFVDIAAFDSGNNQLWNTTADLRNYTAWNNWLDVSVGTGNISKLTFYAPGNAPHYNGFWPSIDNMRVNEVGIIPEPASLTLLSLGLWGLAGIRKRTKV